MGEFDALPEPLRRWMAEAKRPWSAKTVKRTFDRTIAKTGDPQAALRELSALQDRLLAKDAFFVWGPQYSTAQSDRSA